jgi:hypothetical protein
MASRRPPVDLTIDQRALLRVRDAMSNEVDGKKLRRDLIKSLRASAVPIVPDLQAAVRQLPSTNPASTPDLRDAVADQIKVAVSMSAKNPGVKFRVGTAQDPRGFRFAGRRLNSPKGWRHPVFGRTKAATGIRGLLGGGDQEVWVQQYGRKGVRWFEPTIVARRKEFQAAVKVAVDDMARRIASRATTRG